MVTLSVDFINTEAPYKVELAEEQGFVNFTTDSDVHYSIGFELADSIIGFETYQFYILNLNHQKSPRDRKLKDTIMAVLYDFFRSNNLAMLYLCETGDEKQSLRNRLFEYWARTSKIQDRVSIVTSCVTDEDGIKNYATLILRIDNPHHSEIISAFTQTVEVLNNKPEAHL